jgi:hypothetical protein
VWWGGSATSVVHQSVQVPWVDVLALGTAKIFGWLWKGIKCVNITLLTDTETIDKLVHELWKDGPGGPHTGPSKLESMKKGAIRKERVEF